MFRDEILIQIVQVLDSGIFFIKSGERWATIAKNKRQCENEVAKMRTCLKKFRSILEVGAVQKVQKFVNLVYLVESFLTGI